MTAFVVEDSPSGTTEAAWVGWAGLAALPVFEPAALARVVVIAPHPDDEVLGLGGWLHGARCDIDLVAVTDGEASHPLDATALAELRAAEREAALAQLGVHARIHRLRLPDGHVTAARLLDALAPIVDGACLVLAPWEHDGHPDHDACGAAALACGRPIARYPVWAWHWAQPGAADLPWARARRIPLSAAARAAKATAIAEYRSQVQPLAGRTVVPPHVLEHFQRPYEVVFV